MAFADKSGIGVASGFKLQAVAPLDARSTVSIKSDLTELVTLNAAYKGLLSYNEDDGITYKYGKDGTWFAIDLGVDINDVLANYLPLTANAVSATKLANPFTITIGNASVSTDGTSDVSMTLEQMGISPNTGSTDVGQVGSDVTLGDGESTTASITNQSGDVINKITINNSTDEETNVTYVFQNSTDGGSTYTDLVTIYDNGTVEANTFTSENVVTENISATTINQGGNLNIVSDHTTITSENEELRITNVSVGPGDFIISGYDYFILEGTTSVQLGDATVTAKEFVGELTGNASTASKLKSGIMFTLSGAATGTTSASVDLSSNVNIEVSSIDATKISGIIPLANIPKAAQENVIPVSNITAMYALTTDSVQLGDVVRVMDNGDGETVMYYVIDEANLSNENGYAPFAAGMAASVPVSGVDGLEDWANARYLRIDGGTSEDGASTGATVTVDSVTFNDGINIESETSSITTTTKSTTISNNTDNIMNFNISGYETIISDATYVDFSDAQVTVGSLVGNASSATVLKTARNISISGGVTGTATAFDGSTDITIPVTKVSTSALYVPDGDVLILDGNAA